MWTETTREQHRREHLHYASDMTDAEWALIAPYMPTQKVLGRPRSVPLPRCGCPTLDFADGLSVRLAKDFETTHPQQPSIALFGLHPAAGAPSCSTNPTSE